jgi:hypothetical protein
MIAKRITFKSSSNRLDADAWKAGLESLQDIGMEGADHPYSAGEAAEPPEIEIDISSARFADFPILGRILILAAFLVSKGYALKVWLPSENVLPEERESIEQGETDLKRLGRTVAFARLRRQRQACRLFLTQSGFESALNSGPLVGKVRFAEDDDETQPAESIISGLDPDMPEAFQEPRRLRRFLPYQWLDLTAIDPGASPEAIRDSMPNLSDIEQSLTAIGLPTYDAIALTQGVLAELIENVATHSYPFVRAKVHALLGASLVQANALQDRVHNFDEYLRHFAGWAAEIQTPILRVFVGDAGKGIQIANSVSRSDAESLCDAIISALDHHTGYRSRSTGPRGLWKVKELVRSFQGTVVALTGHASAGYIFDTSEDGRKVKSVSYYPSPGTVIECNLLTASGRELDGETNEVQASASPTTKLTCATVLLRPNIGLDPADQELIRTHLANLRGGVNAGLAVAVEISPGGPSPDDWDIQQAIWQIHDAVNSIARDKIVAVLFSGASSKLLSLAVIDLNLQLDIDAPPEREAHPAAILILTPGSRNYWVGGTPHIRKVLSRLSQTEETQRITVFSNSLDPEKSIRLIAEIHALSHLLHVDAGLVQLTFRPSDAAGSLIAYFREMLADAIAQQRTLDPSNIPILTPSLRRVSQWIDIGSVLRKQRCTRTAGFLLAAGIESRTALHPPDPRTYVVRLGAVDEHLASTFALSLTGRESPIVDISTLARIPHREGAQPRIVLCTDIISNGASVRRTIRELWHLGFTEMAVATVVDARNLELEDRARESVENIMVYNRPVPLFSLTRVSVEPSPASETESRINDLILIDPVIGRPMPRRFPRSKAFGDQSGYKEAIIRTGAARLGHIRRSGRRHYEAYIDTARLFQDGKWSGRVFREIVKRIQEDHKQAQLPNGPGSAEAEKTVMCVIYPGEESDNFGYVAERLTEAICAADLSAVDPVPVPRGVMDGEWIFPREVQLHPTVSHVIAIDSSSKTGATLRHLIRLAARLQVKMISAFAVVNGMTDLEALTLQQTVRVRARAAGEGDTWIESTVPVNVRYLVRTAAASTDSRSCDACALREAYSLLPSLPLSLEAHRDWLLRVLDTQSRENAFAEQATDLFGIPIKQEDCVEYLVWRSFLVEAALGTDSRQFVVNRITELVPDTEKFSKDDKLRSQRDALIRLLAAESSRLDIAPLWFTSVRIKIVALADSILQAPASLAIDPVLRVQALMVLARADVRTFTKQYAGLVRDSRDHKLVLRQALMEAVRLIHGRSGLPDWSDDLADEISKLSTDLQAALGGTKHQWSEGVPIEELNYLAQLMEREIPRVG